VFLSYIHLLTDVLSLQMLIGYIPGKEDIDGYVQKLKDEGKDSLKQIETAASKILQEVEKAKKDGKNQADSFLQGLKQGQHLVSLLPGPSC